MKKVHQEANFKAVVWEEDEQVDLREHGKILELRPIELHVKKSGDKDGKPSYAFVLKDLYGNKFCAQISDRMLQEGLKAAENER